MRPLKAVGGLAVVAALLLGLVTGPAASAAPTRYEAENAARSLGVVEANHTGYSGTGFVNGDNVVGSWVEFTVNAASAGTAAIAIRYANGTTLDRPGDLTVNGTVVSAARSFPSTGTWDDWAVSTVTAPVNAGANRIRLTSTSAAGLPNLDALDLDITAPTADYQAEDAATGQAAVATNHTGYTGTGFVDYTNIAGSYVEFTVSAARPAAPRSPSGTPTPGRPTGRWTSR
ncbi:CBM35 domain-containing protein [Kitasatospora gansuensis]